MSVTLFSTGVFLGLLLLKVVHHTETKGGKVLFPHIIFTLQKMYIILLMEWATLGPFKEEGGVMNEWMNEWMNELMN